MVSSCSTLLTFIVLINDVFLNLSSLFCRAFLYCVFAIYFYISEKKSVKETVSMLAKLLKAFLKLTFSVVTMKEMST